MWVMKYCWSKNKYYIQLRNNNVCGSSALHMNENLNNTLGKKALRTSEIEYRIAGDCFSETTHSQLQFI